MWLTVSGFMVMGLVSGWSLANHSNSESDTTEQLHFHFFLSCIGEGNGNPLHLLGESQSWGSLVGCRLWGCSESDMTEAT